MPMLGASRPTRLARTTGDQAYVVNVVHRPMISKDPVQTTAATSVLPLGAMETATSLVTVQDKNVTFFGASFFFFSDPSSQ